MKILNIIITMAAAANATPVVGVTPVNTTVNTTAVPIEELTVIPKVKAGCWNEQVNGADLEDAKKRFVEWGRKNFIMPSTMYGKVTGDTAYWICNCKRFWGDPVVAAELDEAQRIIEEACGVNRTGWVWSKKWQKSYNIGTTKRLGGEEVPDDKCPRFCVWSV